jgi:hypothetical protein
MEGAPGRAGWSGKELRQEAIFRGNGNRPCRMTDWQGLWMVKGINLEGI